MSTKAAGIIGAAIVVAALIVVFVPDQKTGEPPADAPPLEAGEAGESAGTGSTARTPSLDVPRGNEDVGRLMRELAEAKARIADLEKRGGAGESGDEASAASPEAFAKKRAEVLGLMKAYASGTITREQIGKMMRLVKDKTLMEAVVSSLKRNIEKSPDDIKARLQLAEVESARVHGAESITERAMLAGNVREQIGEVLKRDPENWDARYMRAVGISHSQRTPQGRAMAIKEFESLIALQETRAVEPRFAESYGELAKVYVAERDVAKARAALEQGLARFPDAKDLREQLEALGK